MLDYLADISSNQALSDAAQFIEDAVQQGFTENRLRPMEFGGDMGTKTVTNEVINIITR